MSIWTYKMRKKGEKRKERHRKGGNQYGLDGETKEWRRKEGEKRISSDEERRRGSGVIYEGGGKEGEKMGVKE